MKSDELNPRIRIRSPLRCDGVGRLDCAEDVESGARLAVRWLPLDANGDAAVRASAKLPEHPTLPRVRQTGQVGDKAFLAMEFPDGQLLSTQLGQAINAQQLVEVGAQLADALATVHSQGVVHGEMSAESVLLAKGKAFLWDMPLVIANRLADRRGEERLMHQLVRTAPFLSAERARGGGPTPEGDVYALAAVLCIAAGAPMPATGTTLSVVYSIVTGSWTIDVPRSFQEPHRVLLARMLSREPGRRPTAREAADLFGRPTLSTPTIPEMPAVGGMPIQRQPVLTPPPTLKPQPKAAFFAAPGSLEPMLPTKAVAEAAARMPSRPLVPTVPVKVEETVKVNVPDQVLQAMSHPVPMDSELKAAMRALEPGRREKTPPPTVPLALARERKTPLTPAPAVAPTFADLKHGLEKLEKKTPAPAEAPRASQVKTVLERKTPAPVEAPRAAEVKAQLELEPNTGPMPSDEEKQKEKESVELQDNLAVTDETFVAGAAAVGPEEIQQYELIPRSRPSWLIAAALLAVLTTGLAVGARAMIHRPSVVVVPVAAVAEPVAPQPMVAPVVDEPLQLSDVEEEDELSALPRAPRTVSPRVRQVVKKATPSRLEGGKYDSHSEAAADDFSMPNAGDEASPEALKRPNF